MAAPYPWVVVVVIVGEFRITYGLLFVRGDKGRLVWIGVCGWFCGHSFGVLKRVGFFYILYLW